MNRLQACVGLVNPGAQLDFIVKGNREPDKHWRTIAQELGIDVNAVTNCLADGQGDAVLEEDIAVSNRWRVRYSPTLFLNGQEFEGEYNSLAIFKEICRLLPDGGEFPPCVNPPQTLTVQDNLGEDRCGAERGRSAALEGSVDEREIEATVITYPRSTISNVERIVRGIKKFYPNAKIEYVPYETEKATQLIKKYEIEWLPAYLLPLSISQTKAAAEIESMSYKVKDRWVMSVLNTRPTICLKRKVEPNVLDFYYQPTVKTAFEFLLQMVDVVEQRNPNTTKTRVRFKPFLGMDPSLPVDQHAGTPGYEESLRHIAILENFPEHFVPYIRAREQGPESTYWEDYVAKAGLPPLEVKRLAQSMEMKRILYENSMDHADFEQPTPVLFVYNNIELLLFSSQNEFDIFMRNLP